MEHFPTDSYVELRAIVLMCCLPEQSLRCSLSTWRNRFASVGGRVFTWGGLPFFMFAWPYSTVKNFLPIFSKSSFVAVSSLRMIYIL